MKRTQNHKMAKLGAMISGADDDAFARAIRKFKYRELARIAAINAAEPSATKDALVEWSDVADAIVSAAYDRAHSRLSDKLKASPCPGTVIALGKLGGRELNFSSDIDLVFLYETDDGEGKTSNHEFYVKLASELTRSLGAYTAEGFAFRVDNELRPEGNAGTLANSVDAAERYYQYFGRDWERQALIRARPVAGDLALGSSFIEAVRPFVFRRSVTTADLATLRTMKSMMEKVAAASEGPYDLKFGRGGIREIEFFVQAMQLLYGGRVEALRCGNTFDAIEKLVEQKLMHPNSGNILLAAYSFMRRTENFVQLEDDLQVHKLPDDERRLADLAKAMDIGATDDLLSSLASHSSSTGILFDALFASDYEAVELSEAAKANAEKCDSDEERCDSLAWFKRQELKRIQHLDVNKKVPLKEVLRRISIVAEAVIELALDIASTGLALRHGRPSASFAVVGMGKLGAREMDYGSDVDLMFIFSGDGQTQGPRQISNVEYFTKLAQRVISLISMPARYGRAYIVDSALRPSGGQGTLITSLAAFEKYHEGSSAIWERLALLKARPIAGDGDFMVKMRDVLSKISYDNPPPDASSLKGEIVRLRTKAHEERRERAGSMDLKFGPGGVADVEAAIQFHHLMNAPKHPSLRTQNTFDVLEALAKLGIVDEALHGHLEETLHFFRALISYVRLATGRDADSIERDSEQLGHIASLMDKGSAEELLRDIEKMQEVSLAVYEKTFRTF